MLNISNDYSPVLYFYDTVFLNVGLVFNIKKNSRKICKLKDLFHGVLLWNLDLLNIKKF